jgi:phosphatidate cytidylyltransferase
MNSHGKRWVTGFIVVPVLYAAIAYGSQEVFAGLIGLATLLGVGEYHRLVFGASFVREKAISLVIAVLILLAALAGDMAGLVAVLTFSVVAVLILNLLRSRETGPDLLPVAKVVLGILYVPLLMSHFILMRRSEQGILWIFFILVLAFAGDIAAYYIGRGIGKRKLLAEVSPAKTVEGTIGLFAGSVVGCLIYRQFFFPALPLVHAVIIGFVGSIVGQLGDLCESALKRAAGVKDSGVLLPGHGGILDRLDCLMFIAPFVYYYRMFLIQ